MGSALVNRNDVVMTIEVSDEIKDALLRLEAVEEHEVKPENLVRRMEFRLDEIPKFTKGSWAVSYLSESEKTGLRALWDVQEGRSTYTSFWTDNWQEYFKNEDERKITGGVQIKVRPERMFRAIVGGIEAEGLARLATALGIAPADQLLGLDLGIDTQGQHIDIERRSQGHECLA